MSEAGAGCREGRTTGRRPRSLTSGAAQGRGKDSRDRIDRRRLDRGRPAAAPQARRTQHHAARGPQGHGHEHGHRRRRRHAQGAARRRDPRCPDRGRGERPAAGQGAARGARGPGAGPEAGRRAGGGPGRQAQDQPGQPQAQQAGKQRGGDPAQQGKQGQGKQGQGKQGQGKQDQGKQDQGKQDKAGPENKQDQGKQDQNKGQAKQGGKQDGGQQGGQSKQDQSKQDQNKQDQNKQDQNKQDQNKQDQGDDDEGGSRRNRRRRGRERPDNRGRARNEPDTTILEDDVLVPAAGIVDVLENYAFVRTSGYLAGPDDVYLSLSLVRKHGLRRGDAVVGQVRQPREGERREKFNPMVRVDSVNGTESENVRSRPEFAELTPVSPTERLRLETTPDELVGRAVDLVAPMGKGQRGLVLSPPRAGKSTVLQSLARAISENNPECHLMVLLVDERPEEVTEFERLVKGEVISSTFDRPPSDHTAVAELAIERAKRLVELGHDVVVLADGLTRLGRAYNLASNGGGRLLAGGVDASALHPPKRFFGAARNIENGGSLTVVATAAVETGSATDEVILEELQGTANAELRLRSEPAERRLFPAVDPVRSATRHEELLTDRNQLALLGQLRRVLTGLDERAAHEQLLERLRASRTNAELLERARQDPGAGSRG